MDSGAGCGADGVGLAPERHVHCLPCYAHLPTGPPLRPAPSRAAPALRPSRCSRSPCASAPRLRSSAWWMPCRCARSCTATHSGWFRSSKTLATWDSRAIRPLLKLRRFPGADADVRANRRARGVWCIPCLQLDRRSSNSLPNQRNWKPRPSRKTCSVQGPLYCVFPLQQHSPKRVVSLIGRRPGGAVSLATPA